MDLEDLVLLGQSRGVLIDVGTEGRDREVQRRREGTFIQDTDVLVLEGRHLEFLGEVFHQVFHERIGNQVEEVPVLGFTREDHPAVCKIDHDLSPLTLHAPQGNGELVVEFLGLGESSTLDQRGECRALPGVAGLEQSPDASSLGDCSNGELNYPIWLSHPSGLSSETSVENREQLRGEAVEVCAQFLGFRAAQASPTGQAGDRCGASASIPSAP